MTARIYTFPQRAASFLMDDDEPIPFPVQSVAAQEDERLRWVRTVLLDAERELAAGNLQRGIEAATAALNCAVWIYKQRGGGA